MIEWTIVIGLEEYSVTVEPDEEHGKASVHVEGRPACRPLTRQEPEREIVVGDRKYAVRWNPDGSFEHELMEYLPRSQGQIAEEQMAEKKSGDPMVPIAIILAFLLTAGTFFGVRFWLNHRLTWNGYEPNDHSYRVAMPRPPKEMEQMIDESRNIKMRLAICDLGQSAYLSSYVDFPRVATSLDGEKILKDSVTQQIHQYNGKMVERKASYMKKYEGYVATAELPPGKELPQGGTMRIKDFLVDHRLYILLTIETPNARESHSQRFFDSFELLRE